MYRPKLDHFIFMVVKNFEFSGFLYRNINIDMFKLTTQQQYSILLFLMNYCFILPPKKILDNHMFSYAAIHIGCLIFMVTLYYSFSIIGLVISILPLLVVISLSWCVDNNGNNILDKIMYFYSHGIGNHPIAIEGPRDISHTIYPLLILLVPVIGLAMILATFIMRKTFDCYPEIKIPEE